MNDKPVTRWEIGRAADAVSTALEEAKPLGLQFDKVREIVQCSLPQNRQHHVTTNVVKDALAEAKAQKVKGELHYHHPDFVPKGVQSRKQRHTSEEYPERLHESEAVVPVQTEQPGFPDNVVVIEGGEIDAVINQSQQGVESTHRVGQRIRRITIEFYNVTD